MTLANILEAVSTVLAYVVGGTVDTTTITFANSYVGKFLSMFTTANGWFTVFLLLGLCSFGIRMVWSLMHR